MLWQDMPQLRTSDITTRSVSVTNYNRYSINYRKHVIIWFIVLACNFWYPHFTQHQLHVELLSMITTWLSIKCLFVFSDLPQLQLTTLHRTYTFQLCLANSVSIRLSVALSISRPFATRDLHCLHFFNAILPNIVLTTTQDNDNAQCFVTATSLPLSNNAVPWHEAGKYSQFLQFPATSSLSPFQWGIMYVTQATSHSLFVP
jgi:hypothetical protein